MLNANLALIGWALFCWAAFLYIFWVLVERTFSAAGNLERSERDAPGSTAVSTIRDPRRGAHSPDISTLRRPA